MFNKLKVLLSLTLTMVMMSSCGDLFSDKSLRQEDNLAQFTACSIDTEKLANILTEEISRPLYCLGQNLHLFIDVVEVEKPGYLSHQALAKYIRKNMSEVDEETLNVLGALFEINHLLFDDEINFISAANVDKLVGLLTDLNHIVVSNNILEYFLSFIIL